MNQANLKRVKYITYLFLIGLTVVQLSCKKDTGATIHAETSLELEVFNLINEYRDSIGLGLLTANDAITEECRLHSYNMATGAISFGHDGFNARAERLITTLNGSSVAENVASGYQTAEAVVAGWINSPGHKANIEGDFNLTGIGIVKDAEGRPFYTQIFIHTQ